jgi:GPH family glycoside/pentoside/hexuronide:cation symporter
MNESKREENQEYSLKHSLAFSTASLADVLAYQSFTFLIFTFYFTIVRINVVLISIGFSVWSVWNALNDPLLGGLSDRTHTKMGRRIPWIMASLIPLGLLMIFLYTPPISIGINNELSNFLYFLIIIIVFEFFYTMFSINQTALFPEVFIDKEARAKANTFRQIFIIIALILAFIVPTIFIPDLTERKYLSNYWTFGIFSCIVIILLGLIFLKWGAKEKTEFKDDYKEMPGLIASYKICVKSKSFRWTVFSLIWVWFVFGMLPTIIPLYGKFVLGIENSLYIALLLALAFISAVIFIIVWQKIVIKIGPRKTWMYSMLAWVITLLPLLLISDMIWAFLIFFLMGSGLAGALFLRDITWADIIDEDELNTGVRREAAYYGMNALFMRFSTILIFLAISLVFTSTGWTVYTPEKVTPEVIFGLKLLMIVFPVIALCLAIFGFYMYPLDGERLNEVKEALQKLHAEKKSKL